MLDVSGVSKRFGTTLANDRVSLTLRPGEIHAVLGENGAGKTTLMNILSGMVRPDMGTIRIDGREVRIGSPAEALRLGIGTVYQHFTLVPNLTVLENVALGGSGGFGLDLRAADRRLDEAMSEFGLAVSTRAEIRHLALGERQRVEILKALVRGSRFLLLDEPTSVLSPAEVDGLFTILRRLRGEGLAIALITHKLDEALEICDRVSILRRGRNAGELELIDPTPAGRELARRRIVELMFGGIEPEGEAGPAPVLPEGGARLVLSGVNARGDQGALAVRSLSLELRPGEMFGIAGVDGNGQKELGEVIAGQRRVVSGRVQLDGRDLANRGVRAAIEAGIGYVTDDRLGEGVAPGGSVAENIALKSIGKRPFSDGFWLKRGAIDAEARRLIAQFNVKAPGPGARMTQLSGGNIQKLLLARELAMNPSILVCNKPTNGLDVQTAQFVLRTLRDEAARGKAILLISSELDELLENCDRIGVMYNGELAGVFSRAEADIDVIGRLMLTGRIEAAA